MRLPDYISPSSLALWESDREGFYLKNLAEVRPPRKLQKNYMAIGSAFDAYVKSALHEALFGKGADPRFEFDAIFNEQVEEHLRDWAREAGSYAFDAYAISGAYDDLLAELQKSVCDPQFEFRVDQSVRGVPLMGKPDCRYMTSEGAHVVLDWKVNGFCSRHGSNPYQGYRLIRDGWNHEEIKYSRSHGKAHKLFQPVDHDGLEISARYLEETCKDWADQLSIYTWMLGESVGSENTVVCIDQLVCKPREGQFPLIRVANHRCRISTEWQRSLLTRVLDCWETIQSGYIFSELTREENDIRCELLEQQAKAHAYADDLERWIFESAQDSMKFRKR